MTKVFAKPAASVRSRDKGRGFLTPLRLSIGVPGARKWRLSDDLVYQAAPDWLIRVPRGMATDLASVPRVLRSLALSDPQTAWAAVVHDRLYVTKEVTRPVADAVFFGALIDSGVSRFWAVVYYLGVRFGGWLPWYFRK